MSPVIMLIQALAGFLAALLVGTLVEYVVHRLMHTRKLLAERHARHHKRADAQGVWGEFADYFWPTVWSFGFGFAVSVPAGVGYAAGGLAYCILAAYAHQLHHERPELVGWMPVPVHYVHHRHNMWDANFGILTDLWDRVFGTYERVDWRPARRARDHRLRDFLAIGWRRRGGLIEPLKRPSRPTASGVEALS